MDRAALRAALTATRNFGAGQEDPCYEGPSARRWSRRPYACLPMICQQVYQGLSSPSR